MKTIFFLQIYLVDTKSFSLFISASFLFYMFLVIYNNSY